MCPSATRDTLCIEIQFTSPCHWGKLGTSWSASFEENTHLKRSGLHQREGRIDKGQVAKQGSVRGIGEMRHWGREQECLLVGRVRGEMKRDGVFAKVHRERRVASG